MYGLIDLFDGQWSENIVWTFIHSIWQGVVIALLLKSYLNRTKSNPNRRYVASLTAMGAILACVLVTLAIINYSQTSAAIQSAISALKEHRTDTANAEISATPPVAPVNATNAAMANPILTETAEAERAANNVPKPAAVDWTQILFVCWFAGVIIMGGRIVRLLWGTNRLRRSCRPLCEGAVYDIFCDLKEQVSITQEVVLAVSDRISVPGIIGMAKPIILLPVSMTTGFSTEEIGAILTHELAHIRRYDWLVNMFQLLIEAMLFFNPAIWWISSQIRLEREAACDFESIAVTGEKHRYARLLLEWGTAYPNSGPPTLAAVTGFAGPGKPSPVADRIKRLTLPGYKPTIRFSILSVVGAILISIVLIAGVWKGTDETVRYFGKLLTPSQRIAKMDQLRKAFTPSESDDQKVKISGRVSTSDGKEIGTWELDVWSYRQNTGIGNNTNARTRQNDRFSARVPIGQSIMGGFMEGYAPYFKTLDLKNGQEITDMQIVFDHGFKAKIELVDEQGAPVENVRVKTRMKFGNTTVGKGLNGISGGDGIAILDNAVEHPMTIDIDAGGFQEIEIRDFTPKKGQVHKFVMRESKPAGGIVVSAETGLPIPEAGIRISTKNLGGHTYGFGFHSKVIAKTDTQGKFVLDTLEDDASYNIIIDAQGYGYSHLLGVHSGQEDLKITLHQPVTIKGKVVGDLSELGRISKKVDGKLGTYRRISARSRSDILNASAYQDVIVTEADGAGYFEVENVFGNEVTLSSGSLSNLFKMQITEGTSVHNVLIDLDAKEEIDGRDVTIEFNPPKGMPNPNGRVFVSWITKHPIKHHSKTVAVTDGVGKLKIQAPCELQCKIYQWDDVRMGGYWFERVKDIQVEDLQEIFILRIPLKQAGSIFGKILNSDGSTGYGYHTSIRIVKDPKGVVDVGLITENINNSHSVSTGRYYASPIPFDGKYVITASKGNYLLASKPIKITSSKPIAEYDLKRGRSTAIKGKILFADGSPAVSSQYSVYADAKIDGKNYTWGGALKTTDENGQFIIEDVNPDIQAAYYLRVPLQNDRIKIKSIAKYNTLKLHATKVVAGVVLNEDTEKGIGGIPVSISIALDPKTNFHSGQALTDKNGVFKVTVPENAEVDANIQRHLIRGQYSQQRRKGGHLTFVLRPVNQLSGKLIDADTGEGIGGVMIDGYGFEPAHKSYRSEFCPTTNADGEFVINGLELDSYGVIDIRGYEIVGETEISFSKGERRKDFTIKARAL